MWYIAVHLLKYIVYCSTSTKTVNYNRPTGMVPYTKTGVVHCITLTEVVYCSKLTETWNYNKLTGMGAYNRLIGMVN